MAVTKGCNNIRAFDFMLLYMRCDRSQRSPGFFFETRLDGLLPEWHKARKLNISRLVWYTHRFVDSANLEGPINLTRAMFSNNTASLACQCNLQIWKTEPGPWVSAKTRGSGNHSLWCHKGQCWKQRDSLSLASREVLRSLPHMQKVQQRKLISSGGSNAAFCLRLSTPG